MNAQLFETKRLLIFSAIDTQCELVCAYLLRNHSFFKPWVPAVTKNYYGTDHQHKLISEDLVLLKHEHKIKLYITTKAQPNYIIGDFCYSNIIKGSFQSCYLGYKQDEKSCGHGYMLEAIQKLNHFIFDDLKLNRIEANIIPRNTKSINLIKKLGFEEEGYSKKYIQINQVWEDHIRFAKLRNDEK